MVQVEVMLFGRRVIYHGPKARNWKSHRGIKVDRGQKRLDRRSGLRRPNARPMEQAFTELQDNLKRKVDDLTT